VQLTARLLHRKKKSSALLKIDIAKAFDSVSWSFLLAVLKHLGFSRRWLNWVSILLSTASTKILANGSPGKRICHARGLRQDDPLSPLLFVLVMEALNALITAAERHGLLQELCPQVLNRTSLYADDVVVFVAPEEQQLVAIRDALELFAAASGLCANLHKSQASPIQCSLEETCTIIKFFPCRLAAFPCKYLGIPLSIYKLSKEDLQPLVDSVATKLPSWKAGLLTKAGRRVLTRVTLSAMAVHTAIALEL
jgi:hypothetical protein